MTNQEPTEFFTDNMADFKDTLFPELITIMRRDFPGWYENTIIDHPAILLIYEL